MSRHPDIPSLPRPEKRLPLVPPGGSTRRDGQRGRAPLRGNRMLAAYLTGEAASTIGTSVYAVALPVLAVLQLHATATQVAHLYVLSQAPNLLVTLPAGAFADRRSKKPILIATDLTAAGLVAALPATAATGTLSMPVLYAVAFLLGTVTVIHQAAAGAILPHLVPPELLHRATARQEAVLGASSTGGAYLGIAVLGFTGAARAVALDSVSYLVSAWCTSRIPTDPAPPSPRRRTKLSAEVWEGARFVARDPILRPLALCLGGTGAGAGVISAVSGWYLLTVIKVGPTGLGVIMGVSAAGYLVGALVSPRLTTRFGPGAVLISAVLLYPALEFPLLFAGPGRVWLPVLSVAGALQLAVAACASATVRVVRQLSCPPELQARAQQTSAWLVTGSRPLAALAAGVFAATAGVWATLVAGTFILAVTGLALWASPVRGLAAMPTPVTDGSANHG